MQGTTGSSAVRATDTAAADEGYDNNTFTIGEDDDDVELSPDTADNDIDTTYSSVTSVVHPEPDSDHLSSHTQADTLPTTSRSPLVDVALDDQLDSAAPATRHFSVGSVDSTHTPYTTFITPRTTNTLSSDYTNIRRVQVQPATALEDDEVVDSAKMGNTHGKSRKEERQTLLTVDDKESDADEHLAAGKSYAAGADVNKGAVTKASSAATLKPFHQTVFGAATLLLLLTATSLLLFNYLNPPQPLQIDICDILCYGPIVGILQQSGLFNNDTKTLVDMPLKMDPIDVWSAFWNLPDLKQSTLKQFVSDHFAREGSDLIPWLPSDYVEHPPFLQAIEDPHMRVWCQDLHDLWRLLGRQLDEDVYLHPQRHTLIPLKAPQMIVPGGRFREFYYWDTYFIILGLLVSNMSTTAQLITNNLLQMVVDFGHIPNGSRRYYLNRSQPPFVTQMVAEVYAATQDRTWLETFALPTLDKEYQYWMTIGDHAVEVTHPDDVTQTKYILNRHFSQVSYPRPESYLADAHTAEWLLRSLDRPIPEPADSEHCNSSPLDASACSSESYMNDKAVQALMSELTASAESGWDFASRWFRDRANLTTAETTALLPVDLNSLMAMNERTLAQLYDSVGNHEKHQYYADAYQRRIRAIDLFMWNATTVQWNDYNHVEQIPSPSSIYVASNFLPLWTKSYDVCAGKVNETAVMHSLLNSGLILEGGIVTSMDNDGQQWDYPNAWAPIQYMLIDGISNTVEVTSFDTDSQSATPQCTTQPNQMGHDLSVSLAQQWLFSNYVSYNDTGFMFEKYYAPKFGAGNGQGGEYISQTGFGWTNGVAMALTIKFNQHLNYQRFAHQHAEELSDRKHRKHYHPLDHHIPRHLRPSVEVPYTIDDIEEEIEAEIAQETHSRHRHHTSSSHRAQAAMDTSALHAYSRNGLIFDAGSIRLTQ